MRAAWTAFVLLPLAVACAPAAQSGAPRSAAATAVARGNAEQQVLDSVDIALARTGGHKRLFEWRDDSRELSGRPARSGRAYD